MAGKQYSDEELREEELYTGTPQEMGGVKTTSPTADSQPLRRSTLRGIVRIVSNKYLITILAFVIWVLFFDGNNLLSRFRVKKELNHLHHQKEYYQQEITLNEKLRDQLMNDLDQAEAYGREHYLMKRDNEDIYLIIDEETKL